jgi:IS5 family transposase
VEDTVRQTRHEQLPIVPIVPTHDRALELVRIGAALDKLPNLVELIHADLIRREDKIIDPTKGRTGMTAEQVLRVLIAKHINRWSYEELEFHLADSLTYRSFCRIGIDQDPPQKSTLQKNVKKIRPETVESINRQVVLWAADKRIENGARVRADTTVVESNIHHPTDSALLRDCVKVLVRLMCKSKENFGFTFTNHHRCAKRRALAISNAKSFEEQIPHYRVLIDATQWTLREAESIAAKINALKTTNDRNEALRKRLERKIRHYAMLSHKVIDQAERRVFRKESVPAHEKVVSIFEPHTDIITKARRNTHYGHKICLTTGKSGIITDVVVEKGNPADVTLAVRMIERQRALYGNVPRQASFDGGFTSRSNLTEIKQLGVKDAAFARRGAIKVTEMVKSDWVYRSLRNFRAGIEGNISFLKRTFGLDRCTWSSLDSFKAYVYSAVLSCNLLNIARHLINDSGP